MHHLLRPSARAREKGQLQPTILQEECSPRGPSPVLLRCFPEALFLPVWMLQAAFPGGPVNGNVDVLPILLPFSTFCNFSLCLFFFNLKEK